MRTNLGSTDETIPQERERESLKDETRTAVDEARMVLPGVQALFGFQLIAVFNAGFERLPYEAKLAHLVSLGLVTTAIAFIMAPAAFHRIAERGWVSRRLVDLTSNFLSCGMAMLMLGLAIEVALDTYVVLHAALWGVLVGIAIFMQYLFCWFVFPLTNRRGSAR